MKTQKFMYSSSLFNIRSLLAVAVGLVVVVHAEAQTWSNAIEQFVLHPGPGVYELKIHQGKLIVGGGFIESQQGELYSRIFSWDGESIEHFGCGFTNVCDSLSDPTSSARVRDVEIFQDTIYACGSFHYSGETVLNGIAKWDGMHWLPVDSGFNGQVTDMQVIDGKLHAVGWFTQSGATGLNGVAVLDNGQWHDPYQTPVFSNLENAMNRVGAIQNYQGRIYIGGNLGTAGSEVQDLAVYDPETGWGAVNGWAVGPMSFVACMDIYQNKLIIGGNFSRPQNNGSPGNYVCTYDGENWDDLSGGLFNEQWPSALNIVYDIFVEGNELYVSGLPLFAGGQSTSGVALWNGDAWCVYNPDFEFTSPMNSIQSICKFQDAIYIGGSGSIILGDELDEPELLNVIVRIAPESADCTVQVGEVPSKPPTVVVYPNPVATQLTVETSQGIESLRIVDSAARMVYDLAHGTDQSAMPQHVDVSAWPNGLYVLIISHTNGQRSIHRFAVNR